MVGLQRHQLLGEDLAADSVAIATRTSRSPKATPASRPPPEASDDEDGAAAVADAAGQADHAGLVEFRTMFDTVAADRAGGGGDLDLGQRAVLPDDSEDALAVGFAQRSLRARRRAGCIHYIKITDRGAYAAAHRP